MPIYEFGYRPYEGPLGSQRWRWLVITRQGVRLALRGKLVRRLLFIAWTPMLYFAVIFFMIGTLTENEPQDVDVPGLNEPGFWEDLWKAQQPPANHHHRRGRGRRNRNALVEPLPDAAIAQAPPDLPEGDARELEEHSVELRLTKDDLEWMEFNRRREAAQETMQKLQAGISPKQRAAFAGAAAFLGPRVALRLVYDAPRIRSAAWTTCFFYYVDRVQVTLMIFVVMIVAPPLVANDLRGRSFLIYFSSAVTRRDYVVGKLAVVMTIVALATLLPGLALYMLSIAFSPSFGALADTIHVALRMLLVIAVVGIPSSLGALYLSARTTHPRFAAFTWIAIWIMGGMFYAAVVNTVSESSKLHDWAFLLSPAHITTMLSEWIFGVRGELEAVGATDTLKELLPEPGFAMAGLLFVTLLSALAAIGIVRRITAPMNV